MNVIPDTIREIIERADEAKAAYDADTSDNLNFGKLLAFSEVLSLLKADFMGEEAVEKLLDFDIDRKYLIH